MEFESLVFKIKELGKTTISYIRTMSFGTNRRKIIPATSFRNFQVAVVNNNQLYWSTEDLRSTF